MKYQPEQTPQNDRRDKEAWIGAIGLFGIGDVSLTVAGLSIGAYEANPVARHLFGQISVAIGNGLSIIIGMLLLKIAVIGVAYALWKHPHGKYVPHTLTAIGAIICANNIAVILYIVLTSA